MASAALSSTRLSGQALVDAFMVDLRDYLKKTPTKSLKGTKRMIIETVVRESPRLQHCNIDNLVRQLQPALNAPCRQHLGLRYKQVMDPDGNLIADQLRVVIA